MNFFKLDLTIKNYFLNFRPGILTSINDANKLKMGFKSPKIHVININTLIK